jgi:hypothetical protein
VSLQYADDTILFSRIEEEYTRNLKVSLFGLNSCLL